MAIELTIERSKIDAQEAITQFAARRGYQLTNPWYLDGLRIEDVSRTGDDISQKAESSRGFWAGLIAFFHVPGPGPRVDIELKRRKGRTVVSMSLGGHRDSVHLAYALRSYLSDNRAFTCECPPLCPACSAVVWNYAASYCCQCGHLLVSRPPIPMNMLFNKECEPADVYEPALASAQRSTRKQSKDSPKAKEREATPDEQSAQGASVELESDTCEHVGSRVAPVVQTAAPSVSDDGASAALRSPAEPEAEAVAHDERAVALESEDEDSGAGRHKLNLDSTDDRPARTTARRLLAED